MKKVLIIFLLVFAGQLSAQESLKSDDDFKNMTFKIELNKEIYNPLENVFVTFTLLNETNSELSITPPNFIGESKLKVMRNDKSIIYDVSQQSQSTAMRFSAKFKKGDKYQQTKGISILRKELFPEPGTYGIQFILSNEDRTCSIESNIIKITVVEPEGINQLAYNFLAKYEDKYIYVFGFMSGEKDGDKILEEFVRDYSESIYGDEAIYNLGMLYQVRGQFVEAEQEFNKIKNSSNKQFADEAKRYISDIQKLRNQ